MNRKRILGAIAGVTVAAVTAATLASALGPKVDDPIPAAIPPSGITVGVEPVASGFNSPVKGVAIPGTNKYMAVVDQVGKLYQVDLEGKDGLPGNKVMVADLTSLVVPLGCFGLNYDERGFLGVAFHPQFRENGKLYTFTSETGAGRGDCVGQVSGGPPNHENVIREWRVRSIGGRWIDVFPTSRVVLKVDHPQFNHNGGDLAFGRDGYLYIGIGDGGAADDQGVGHSPQGNAQDPGNLLGKILRIDVDGRNVNNAYSVPFDNPFVNRDGRDEIYAWGFRNPYRMSFGRDDGKLYVADVGQNDIEEVNLVEKGKNYGWPIKEGTFVFNNNDDLPGFVTADPSPPGLADPFAQYDHPSPVTGVREGIAVVGGHAYDGRLLDRNTFRGKYIFGDYSRAFAQPLGRLFIADITPPQNGGTVTVAAATSEVKELAIADKPAGLGIAVMGFGEDRKGEVYIMGNTTGVVRGETGVVWRITRPGGSRGNDSDRGFGP